MKKDQDSQKPTEKLVDSKESFKEGTNDLPKPLSADTLSEFANQLQKALQEIKDKKH